MTRLANIEKAGYFPLPPTVTDLILTYIAALQGGRILDPCAGKGVALVTLAETLNLDPFGVELHEERAQEARALVQKLAARQLTQSRSAQLPDQTRILNDSYLNLSTSKNGYNLLYLNPPYDWDNKDGRLEYQFLWKTRPWLQPGGLLVYVVPRHILKMRKAAKYIAAHYDQVRVYRFPDGEYEQFKQIVLFGIRRPNGIVPDAAIVDALIAMGQENALPVAQRLEPLTAVSEPIYTLPPLAVKDSQFKFRSMFVDPTDALAEARQTGASTTDAWRQQLDPAGVNVPLRPLTPLKIGHMNSIIAAGHMNNQVLEDGDGERLLIKGRSYKTTREESYEEPLPSGGKKLTTLETEVVVTDITTVDEKGEVQSHNGPGLEQFLSQWIGKLTNIVASDYPPVYQFSMNGYGALLGSLSKERRIPGLNGKTGLLPAQKHAVAAVLTRLEACPDAIVVGEMGSGKAQPLDSKVLTPTGWERMGDIRIGDEVINPEGGTAHVVGVYPQGKKKIYRVTFSDGAQTECCDEHLWQVNTPLRKWRDDSPQVLQLQEMKGEIFSKSGNAKYFIPMVKPIAFEQQALLLDPYLLGSLIGDGSVGSGNPAITSMDEEIIKNVRAALPEGLVLKHQDRHAYRIIRARKPSSTSWAIPSNTVTQALRQMNLYGAKAETKFIPEPYLFANVSSRIALLQGLLDTDGTIGRHSGRISFTTVSEQLAKDFAALVQSLGGVARTNTRRTHYKHNGKKRIGRLSYRIGISLPNEIQPFRLSLKLERVIPRTKYRPSRAIVEVEYVGKKEAQCIALDSENQLYATDDYIVTHNTTIGAGIAAGRKAQRTIVLCPPHLVDKWQREFKAVWSGVVTMHLQTISDVDAFFAERRACTERSRSNGRPVVGVLKQTTARSASGWEHAYDYGGPASHSYGSKGFTDVIRPWGNVITANQAVGDENQTLTAKQLQAIHQRGVGCPVCGTQQQVNGRPLSPRELKGAKRFCNNMACCAPLFQFKRRRSESQQRGSFKLYAEREKIICNYTHKSQPVPFHELNCWSGTVVKDRFGYGKVPLAGYIKKVARGRLDLCLVDEQHQYKGDDSDQGYAMHHLALAAQKIVGLTGTIYGGKASSIFHLLYRMSPEMTAVYTSPDANGRRRIRSQDWVASYGILQRIETRKLDEDGRQTANSRTNVRTKELPGGSPAMLPWLLNRSVFLSLGDMGFPLPDYTEIPMEVPMAPEQAMLYETLKEQLKEELQERLVRGDKSLLSAYLYALLFWPDSPRRAKVVSDPRTGEVVASIPGLPEAFIGPKEEAIIELCQQEKAEGRKVLLLCLQTDTLDIQPEWKRMLEEAGLKTAILSAAPNKREDWVEKQVQAGVDVIISHPKKVETGIDLLDFSTIVWMSPHYSVYTVLQASRRSWRIGQTRPVKVYYFSYADTIQEQALYLVAAKVAASLRVNGDTVADDSGQGTGLAELDGITGSDIVTTLARIVTGDAEVNTRSLQQAFAEANASLRQSNTVIGEYEIMDDEPEQEVLTRNEAQTVNDATLTPQANPKQTLMADMTSVSGSIKLAVASVESLDAFKHVQQAQIVDELLPIGMQQSLLFSHGYTANGRVTNGKSETITIPANAHHNGRNESHPQPNGNGAKPKHEADSKRPPVPRPRLLIGQLAGRN